MPYSSVSVKPFCKLTSIHTKLRIYNFSISNFNRFELVYRVLTPACKLNKQSLLYSSAGRGDVRGAVRWHEAGWHHPDRGRLLPRHAPRQLA